jgi:hypothetical protein
MRILVLAQRFPRAVPRAFAAPQFGAPRLPAKPDRRLGERGETQQFGTFIALYVVAVGGRVRLR